LEGTDTEYAKEFSKGPEVRRLDDSLKKEDFYSNVVKKGVSVSGGQGWLLLGARGRV